MSDKYDNFYNDLKSKQCISLYYNRVMFYNDGFGEIQFWNLSEDENGLKLSNSGCEISFDNWKVEEDNLLYLYNKENLITKFILPKPARLAGNHNTFYVEEFTKVMEDVLNKNVKEKGDWACSSVEQDIAGIKHNLGKLKLKSDEETFRKSCIDIANYAVMAYYLFENKKGKQK